jgi:ferredoxin-type protein NapF
MSSLLEGANVYFLYPIDMNLFTWGTVLVPVVTVVLIIWLSLFFGRIYCNSVCPVGTLLGLISRISIFRIRMDSVACTRCGKCSIACKSSCIDVKKMQVDFSRCVACYNCVSVCPESSIRYELALPGPSKPRITDTSKRDFIGKTLLYGAAATGISRRVFAEEGKKHPAGLIPNNRNHPVSPPGSISLEHFNSRCTACHLCLTACPTKVLQPSYLEYGFTGMMQPFMNFNVEYCNYECTKCSEVCPTGAILPLTVEDKKLTQTGRVKFIREKCIVITDNTACGSCSEHCPTQAVKMVPYKDNLTLPETKEDICIGCGACEFACPVKPHKSIFVDGNAVHQVASKPVIEELEVKEQEDFPF